MSKRWALCFLWVFIFVNFTTIDIFSNKPASEEAGSLKIGKVWAAAVKEKIEPKINIWFDSLLYRKEMIAKGSKQFIVEKPQMKFDISILPPYSLIKNINAFEVKIDGEAQPSPKISVSTAPGMKEGGTLHISYLPEKALLKGRHIFSISVRYKEPKGETLIHTETASVEVLGGPLRVINEPLAFPSPFSVSKDKTVKIQYNLSQAGNVMVCLVSVGGEAIKVWKFSKEEEGGKAGRNKIEWNGKMDSGNLAGNAVYVGLIRDIAENRLLAKFKLSIFD